MSGAAGAGMVQAIDLLMQEAIVLGLHALVEDARAMDELVGRTDALRNNTAEDWRSQLVAALRDALDPQSDEYVQVVLGFPVPWGASRLPAIGIVQQGGGENESEALVGDEIRTTTDGVLVGPEQELYETVEQGGGWTTSLQISVWSPIPELSALLDAALVWALQHQTPRLIDMGIHNLDVRDGAPMEVNPELEPRVTFVPMHQVTCGWTRRQSFRRRVPNRVRFLAPSFST